MQQINQIHLDNIVWLNESYKEAKLNKQLQKKQIAAACGITEQGVNKWFKTGKIDTKHIPTLAILLDSHPLWMSAGQSENPFTFKYIPVTHKINIDPQGNIELKTRPKIPPFEYTEFPTKDALTYGVKISNQSINDAFQKNWYLIFEPCTPPKKNEMAMVKTIDGKCFLATIINTGGKSLSFQGHDKNSPITLLSPSEIDFIHLVSAIVPPRKIKQTS